LAPKRRQIDPLRRLKATVRSRPTVPDQQRLPNIEDKQVGRRSSDDSGGVCARLAVSPMKQLGLGLVGTLVLRFKDEVVALEQINEVRRLSSVAVHDGNRKLEFVTAAGRTRRLYVESHAELDQIRLKVRPLRRGRRAPALREILQVRFRRHSV